jgi:predicted kinase
MPETTSTSMPQPALVVVTGRPGAGKTTLAHALARAIRCPAICRDEIKEGLVNTTGQAGEPGDEVARQVCETFFDAVKLLLGRRITLVAEAAFQHQVWEPRLQPLLEIARIRIVVCDVDPALARSRHIDRSLADPSRQRFHHDRAAQAAPDHYHPPQLDLPTLRVDTSDAYRPDFDTIVSFACAR